MSTGFETAPFLGSATSYILTRDWRMTKRKLDSLGILTPEKLGEKPNEPFFISHLLAPERIHDCYFLLGEKHLQLTRIGAVKQMLLAHSSFFRECLHEDKKNEPETIIAAELTPPTLQNLLRYIYGFDTTSVLSFDEANRLLYAADKFLMDSLKNNLAARLASLLSYENICLLLNNPVCSQQLTLKRSINKILQFETEKVLANPLFLELNVDGFVKILEQDALMVPEIELWRAALKWATKRVGSKGSKALRNELEAPLKHIRLCTLDPVNLCREVIPSGVLTDAEVRLITTSVGLGKKQSNLTLICNEIRSRRNPFHPGVSDVLTVHFAGFTPKCQIKVMSLGILTKDHGLELLPFEFIAKNRPNQEGSDTYECSCSIQVINEVTDSKTRIEFTQMIKYAEPFTVPIQSGNENVRLMPNTKYSVNMSFTQSIWCYYSWNSPTYRDIHFDVSFTAQKDGWCLSPIKQLSYRTWSVDELL